MNKPEFGFFFLFSAFFVFLKVPGVSENHDFYEITSVKEVWKDIKSTRRTLVILILTSIFSAIIAALIHNLIL